jgi:hypothetical protein
VTHRPETFEEWRERTAPPRPAPLTFVQRLRSVAGIVGSGALFALLGEADAARLLFFVGVVVLIDSVVEACVPADRRTAVATACFLVLLGVLVLVRVLTGAASRSDWIGIGVGLALAAITRLWGRYRDRRARLG